MEQSKTEESCWTRVIREGGKKKSIAVQLFFWLFCRVSSSSGRRCRSRDSAAAVLGGRLNLKRNSGANEREASPTVVHRSIHRSRPPRLSNPVFSLDFFLF